MRIFHHDRFVLPLPEGHRFPMRKYSALRETIEASTELPRAELEEGPGADDDDLLLVHEPGYLERIKRGALSAAEVRRIGFPWSEELVERSRRSVGSTVAAVRAALDDGIAVNLAGGTHHAFADRGQGYCVFNDAAVGARVAQRDLGLPRVAIIDCDVHQGNGTAAIFRDDPSVFTFSIHGGTNFPFEKEESDLDVALPDGTEDEEYLSALDAALHRVFAAGTWDLVLYLAGADPYEKDQLGRLALTRDGLSRRDDLVFATCRAAHVPVAVSMAGGYAREIDEIVAIHYETVRRAHDFHAEWNLLGREVR